MTPHDGSRLPPPRPSSRGHQPSFSAALLDAIYHSLEADAEAEARPSTEARRTPASSPTTGRRHRPAPETTSPPAASSVRSPRLQRPPRPCRVRPDPLPSSLLPLPPLPPAPPREEEATGDRSADRKRRGRGRKAKKAKVAPFACLLNALLCNRKSSAERTPRAAFAAPEPTSARSILSSRASRRESAATGGGVLTPARRAVRFSPVAVVVGDECGGGGVVVTDTALRDAEAAGTARQAEEAERKVEELLRALGVPEELERAKESSESSSDLFELDTLPAFQDAEMPRPRAGLLARPRPRVQ